MNQPEASGRLVVPVASLLLVGSLIPLAFATPPGQARPDRALVAGPERPVQPVVDDDGRPHGALDMNVKPKSTEVWVDGRYRGTCEAFDGHPRKLRLLPGLHRIKLVTPGGRVVQRDIRVRAGSETNVGLDLR